MIDYMFNMLICSLSDSHLAGINMHFYPYLETKGTTKVSWATILEQTPSFTKYTVPKSFEATDEYKRLAKSELRPIPRIIIDISLN